MLGKNPGYVTSQGEILAGLLGRSGCSVRLYSSFCNRYLRMAEILYRIIEQRKHVDVLMIQVYSGPSFVVEDAASWLGKKLGYRIIMTLHGGDIPKFIARFPGWSRRVFSRANRLVVPSGFLARALKNFGFGPGIISNVIDYSSYPYRSREKISPRMLWMRAFHPIYNPAMAVRVLAAVKVQFPCASLVMAGQEMGMTAEIKTLAEKLKVSDAISFPGFLNDSKKFSEGDKADIFLNTNRVDNMPVTLLEACAMGLPVVSTRVGGIPDLISDGETGLLVPDNDHEAMARAVIRLLKDPVLAKKLSENGRRLAQSASWEEVRPKWEKIISAVVRK